MGEGDAKSWWQSPGGTLTGIAALITAITGLILALRGTHVIDSGHSVPEATRIESGASDIKPADVQSQRLASRSALVRSAAATVDKESNRAPEGSARAVALPQRREYVLGNIYNKGRYTLLSAELTRRIPETNQLTIAVRVTAEGQDVSPLGSSQFTVDIDDRPTQPKVYFTDRIPSGESRERELHFTVPATTTRTMFRIRVAPDYSAEIPLTLEQ